MKSVSITVRGRVQGVGFRNSTLNMANQLGVNGFVRNERDRSVYIEAEADEAIMDSFIAWCSEGPGWARVDKIVVNQIPLQHFDRFSIR